MLTIDTLDFLSDLKKNNNRDWFAANKHRYDNARADVEALVNQLIGGINEFDSIGSPEPKKCMFRIYRDTRFSANKEPYKVNMGAILRAEEHQRGFDHADYYLHIESGNCFLSCGVYMPAPAILKALRTAIYEDFESFFELLHEPEFEKTFGDLYRDEDVLKRVPTGFDKDHPSADYLKLKHYYVFTPISDKDICSDKFVKQAQKIFKASKPLKDWLNRIIEDAV